MQWNDITTPSYVIDVARLEDNLSVLRNVEQEAGCHVLLAQKAFSAFFLYPLIGRYLSGTSSSGLFEARLSHEYMGKENHVHSLAYKDADMLEIASICDHVIFNSVAQYKHHREAVAKYGGDSCSIGLRINPECSTQDKPMYDPCAPYSRMGITYHEFIRGFTGGESCAGDLTLPNDIKGLHFHTLCEQGADALIETFTAFEKQFAPYLQQVEWLNLGGGHHITKPGYDISALVELIAYIKKTYGVEIYIEPGEAVALNAGYLVCEVLDIVRNDMDIAILDTSAACHMPDVLEMPYRPPLRNSHPAGESKYTYRLASCTCLAGDTIGDYSFDNKLHVGDRLVFEDMAIYTMVKNNTFNGMPLPSIYLLNEDGTLELVREFGYDDFEMRLS